MHCKKRLTPLCKIEIQNALEIINNLFEIMNKLIWIYHKIPNRLSSTMMATEKSTNYAQCQV